MNVPNYKLDGGVVNPNAMIPNQNQFNMGGEFQLTGYIHTIIAPNNLSTNLATGDYFIGTHIANVIIASMNNVTNDVHLPSIARQWSNIYIQNNCPSTVTLNASANIQYYGTDLGLTMNLKAFHSYRFVFNPATNGWLCAEETNTSIRTQTTKITAAQLLAMNTTPIVVFPSILCSGDVYAFPISCYAKSSTGTPYDITGLSSLQIKAGSYVYFEDIVCDAILNPDYATNWSSFPTGSNALLNANTLQLTSNANPTLGTLDLEVNIVYQLTSFSV
jgi:hypothetical protein